MHQPADNQSPLPVFIQGPMSPRRERRDYILNAATIATLHQHGRRSIVHVPAGALITVCGPLNESKEANRQVEVEWQGQTLKMFAVDILERGERHFAGDPDEIL